MLNLTNLMNKLEEKYPLELAESWDNVGLLIGSKDKNISKVLVCLDITNNVVEKAIYENVDLIISHHPLIFHPQKRILEDELQGNKIIKLIENKISVYSIHTNLDSAKEGLNDYVLKKIGIKGKILDTELIPLRYMELDESIDLYDFCNILKKNLFLENMRLVETDNKIIKNIAITTGDGSSFIKDLNKNVDLFITGDLKHHISLDAYEEGLNLLDIEHYGSEKFCVDILENTLKNIDEKLEIIKYLDSKVFKHL